MTIVLDLVLLGRIFGQDVGCVLHELNHTADAQLAALHQLVLLCGQDANLMIETNRESE